MARIVTLQEDVPLSESVIWSLQRRWYAHRGLAAWSEGEVPHWITNSSTLAALYTEVLTSWALDGLRTGRIRPGVPLDVLEIGAGAGLLASRVLEELRGLRSVLAQQGVTFRWILADIAPKTLDALAARADLLPSLAEGSAALAQWSPEDGPVITLRHGEVLRPGALAQPLFVVANYLLDSLPCDLVRLDDPTPRRGRVSVRAESPPEGPPDATWLRHCQLSWSWDEAARMRTPFERDLLDFYLEQAPGRHAVWPTGALRALEVLDELCTGRFALLAADKGSNDPSTFGGAEHEKPVFHGGCFSFDANLDALGRWAQDRGGLALHNAPDAALKLLFLDPTARPTDLSGTRITWHRATTSRDPGAWWRHLVALVGHPSPELLTTALPLFHHDPYLLQQMQASVLPGVKSLAEPQRSRLLRALDLVLESDRPLGPKPDLPFLAGALAFEANDHERARAFFQRSIQVHGPSTAAAFNIGLSLAREERWGEALPWFEQAQALNPDFEPAGRFRRLAEQVVHPSAPEPSEGPDPAPASRS